MSKYLTVYEPNEAGEIEKIETVDGVVINEGNESGKGFWSWVFGKHQTAESYFDNLGKPPKVKNGARTFNPKTGESDYEPGDVLPEYKKNPYHARLVVERPEYGADTASDSGL